jgi:hypothetical protein
LAFPEGNPLICLTACCRISLLVVQEINSRVRFAHNLFRLAPTRLAKYQDDRGYSLVHRRSFIFPIIALHKVPAQLPNSPFELTNRTVYSINKSNGD